MPSIKIIKTLPHIIPYHVGHEGIYLWSETYTPQIAKYILSLGQYNSNKIKFDSFLPKISQNFTKADLVNKIGEFSTKGDIIEIWPPGYKYPIRLSFYDQDLEYIRYFDLLTRKTINDIGKLVIGDYAHLDDSDIGYLHIADENMESDSYAIFSNYQPTQSDQHQELELVEYDYTFPSLLWNRLDILEKEVSRLHSDGYKILIKTRHLEKLSDSIKEKLSHEHPLLTYNLPAGVLSPSEKLVLFTDREIFGTIYIDQRVTSESTSAKVLAQLAGEISVGSYVVHEDHGIGLYSGLTQEDIGGSVNEFMQISYADEAEVLVPLTQIKKITKYIGPEGQTPKLSKLGRGASWEKVKNKVKASVAILARELLEHLARRELSQAFTVPSLDSPEFLEFVEEFPHTETADQLVSINEVISDLQSPEPMNRLLIGDVGFGKTEVMMRSAYKICEAGYQVAVLCPTTVLASQHYAVFRERFARTPFRVTSLSRFNTNKENREAVDQVNLGGVDIVIGTHRLLSKDVRFSQLGLLIVDEEQRFGVKQKEKIKQLNYGTHYLAVSATPIPRTLGMALSSIQDISVISEPPQGRLPIATEIIKPDWNKITSAVIKEIQRGGQVYFVHNSVQSINSIKAKIHQMIPGARVVIGHGQMSPSQLDKSMSDFYQKKYDILLSTTIIENGLDLPNVNTMIINSARKFGLSQLYQLRGRVGRGSHRGYCLLINGNATTNNSSDDKKKPKLAEERLQTLADSSDLGAGFRVASKDLELRGAGNILGEKQSGHISEIGYALYMQLLSTQIEKLKQLKQLRKPEYLTL